MPIRTDFSAFDKKRRINKKIVIFGIGFEENTLPCLLQGFPFHINAANGKKRELEL